jgi:hypothetical protein
MDLPETIEVPLELAMFPLESALLPDEDLPLRIFEPRYGALVRHCTDNGDPFGVVLISRGREVGGDDARSDVGVVARIVDWADHGEGLYSLHCRSGERIRVSQWLPDDPYPRAIVALWPDEAGEPVSAAQLQEIEDRAMELFERIAQARDIVLPDRDVLLGGLEDSEEGRDPGRRLLALASRIPIGTADRYSILSAPTAAERLVALSEAVDAVAEIVEFGLSE